MNNILVTTDFSANSKAGIRFASQLAQQLDCRLVFYHAVEILKPTSWSDKRYKAFAAEKVAEHTQKLKNFVHSADPSGNATMRGTFIAELGTYVVPMIEKMAKKQKSDFICMSTRGAGTIRKILGTHASALITTSATPVISVPSGYKTKPVKDIFYASDLAALPTELKKVKVLAQALDAKINVYYYDILLNISSNLKAIEKKAARFRSPGITFNFRKQDVDKPLSAHLRAEVEKTKPSLVVLFTKQNRNWFERLLLSSESADMSFHLNVPLLTYRKKKK